MNWYKRTILSAKSWREEEFLGILRKYFGVIAEPASKGKVLTNPSNGQKASFHIHKGRDVGPGTVNTTLRYLGIPKQNFFAAAEGNFNLYQEPQAEAQPKKEEIPEWQKADWYQQQQEYVRQTI